MSRKRDSENRNDDRFWSPSSSRGVDAEFQEVVVQRFDCTCVERHVLRISFPCKRRQLVARLRRLADEIEGDGNG